MRSSLKPATTRSVGPSRPKHWIGPKHSNENNPSARLGPLSIFCRWTPTTPSPKQNCRNELCAVSWSNGAQPPLSWPPSSSQNRTVALNETLLATCGKGTLCTVPTCPIRQPRIVCPSFRVQKTKDLPLRLYRRSHPPGSSRSVLLERAVTPPGRLLQACCPPLWRAPGGLR